MAKAFPEHDKQAKVLEAAQAIGEFLDTCGYTLCEWLPAEGTSDASKVIDVIAGRYDRVEEEYRPEGFYPVSGSINQILAKYFDIDLDKIEAEKREMLELARKLNATAQDGE